MRRRIFLNLVFFAALSVVMVGWVISNVVSIRQLERPYTLQGRFALTGGVGKNAEVTYLGVSVGTVTKVERDTGSVLISMDIDRDVDIPMGSQANIQRKSAIGEPIVDFRPPPDLQGDGVPMPRSSKDFVIPMEQTTVPLEFSELLRSASRLVSSIPPDAVSTLLREAAIGLQGNEQALRTFGDASEELGTTLASRTATLDRLSQNNTALTRLLADKSGTLTQILNDLDLLARTLREGKADTNRLLDEGPAFFSEASSLIEATRPDLDCSLDVLGQVIDMTSTDQKLRELHALLTIGPQAFSSFNDAVDVEEDGAWLRVGLVFSSHSLPPQFDPPKQLPKSNPPKVCATSVAATPSGVDYTPAPPGSVTAAGGAALDILPATGREGALSLVGLLVAAAIAARIVARRTERRTRA